jgi:hypothetical protein
MFELAKSVDYTAHSISAELSVKTSLYLVFAAFVFTASIQLINFAKDVRSYAAVVICAIGAAVALFSAIALLIAALIRQYNIFPAQDMNSWLEKLDCYRKAYPNIPTEDPNAVMLKMLITTADDNQLVNERKADWIECGAWLLFVAIPFLAIGGGVAIYSALIRPF